MFPSHSPEQAAVAAQLAHDLAAYEEGLRSVVRGHWDPSLYRRLSDHFDRMQMLASLLPSMCGCWSELLISRVELTHALWTAGRPGNGRSRVAICFGQHCLLIAEVRRECQEYLAADRA
jgi:hypothetical protein